MEKICRKCDVSKSDNDYRKGRTMCKSCENKIRYIQNKERRLSEPEYNKKWKEYDVKRKRKKESEDSMTMFIQIMRQSIRHSFKRKGYTKKSKSYTILGEEWNVVKNHFESLFEDGMNWDNHGMWHIDHIIPISSAKSEQEVIKLCHYKNLQPLWAKDNRLKSNKV